MAKSADAADLKSADPKGLWGFKSPSRHQLLAGRVKQEWTALVLFRIAPNADSVRRYLCSLVKTY